MAEVLNADGLPPIELTEEQKFIFDTKGWLAIPGVLSDSDITEMRDFAYQLTKDPESIPEDQRSTIGGPLQRLTDHPIVVGFMNEFVAYDPLASEDGYGFRHEGSFRRSARGDRGTRSSNRTAGVESSTSPAITTLTTPCRIA